MRYQKTIRQSLAAINRPDVDARHAEAMIRLEHSTLDHLSREDFRRECEIAAACVDEAGAAMSEKIAQSFAL